MLIVETQGGIWQSDNCRELEWISARLTFLRQICSKAMSSSTPPSVTVNTQLAQQMRS
jgi:hypothetical protein